MKNFPEYRSRKIIGALKIKKINIDPRNNSAVFVFANKEFEPIRVNDQFILKHKPIEGDYYVTGDGHPYCRSAKKFNKEYGAVKKK